MKTSEETCPFEVPPFVAPPTKIEYVWWSWHPLYPYWSKSCWKASTIEEAQKLLDDPFTKLDDYHNKLIRHEGSILTEVLDVPCKRIDIWHKIKKQMESAKSV